MNRRERWTAAKQTEADEAASSEGAIAALYDAARSHMRAGRYLEAQLCCQHALALDADHADTLHLMGLLCLHSRQYDHAVAWLSRAIGLRNPSIAALAAPVFGPNGRLSMCVALMGIIGSFDTEFEGRPAVELKKTAERLSRLLGSPGAGLVSPLTGQDSARQA